MIDGSWMDSMVISRHQNIEHWNKSHGQNLGKVIVVLDIRLDIIATKVRHKKAPKLCYKIWFHANSQKYTILMPKKVKKKQCQAEK